MHQQYQLPSASELATSGDCPLNITCPVQRYVTHLPVPERPISVHALWRGCGALYGWLYTLALLEFSLLARLPALRGRSRNHRRCRIDSAEAPAPLIRSDPQFRTSSSLRPDTTASASSEGFLPESTAECPCDLDRRRPRQSLTSQETCLRRLRQQPRPHVCWPQTRPQATPRLSIPGASFLIVSHLTFLPHDAHHDTWTLPDFAFRVVPQLA